MRRTSPLAITLTALIAGVLAWLAEGMLVMGGRPAIVPPLTLGIALAVLAGALLLVAWPVRQAAHGKRRVDDRYATSVLGFAKASAVLGALVGGAALGALAFFATRAVVPGSIVLALLIVAGGALLQLGAGLLAEHWCVLPPDDEDDVAATAGSAA